MIFLLQINKFLCVILYFFDVFISYRKCQDTLQLNICVKYCMSTLLRQEIKAIIDLNAMYVDTVDTQEKKYAKLDYIYVYLFIISTLSIQHLQNILDLMGLMLIQLNPNTKYLNYIEHQIKCLNYNRI